MTIKISDVDLNKVRTRVRQRGSMRTMQYRGRINSTLAGLSACQCAAQRMNAYQRVNLRGYRVARVPSKGLSGFGANENVALVPVSDKRALTAAVKYFAAARRPADRTNGISGFGDTAQASAAASGAAAGAKAGSIVPGIGTVIGAVVGAVVGWLSAKKKPVRATAEEVAQCRALLSEYMQYANESPNAPIPLDKDKLRQLNWCMDAIYGGHYIGVKDPRWFDPDVEGVFIPAARAVVKKIYETPVGQPVNIEAISFKDPKGRNIAFKGYTFVNPVFTNLKTFSAQVFQPMMVQMCKETAGKGAPGCDDYYGGAVPEFTRWLYDLLAWAAREQLPNISEADLAAASQVAATVPGSSAKDVVTAVETILNRAVQRDETAAVLTNQPLPNANAPPSTVPALPGVTPQSAGDVTALISQLLAQGQQNAQVTQAALDALKSQGAKVTPAVTEAVQNEVVAQAGGLSSKALLTGGGILAALFLLGRPAKRGRK